MVAIIIIMAELKYSKVTYLYGLKKSAKRTSDIFILNYKI